MLVTGGKRRSGSVTIPSRLTRRFEYTVRLHDLIRHGAPPRTDRHSYYFQTGEVNRTLCRVDETGQGMVAVRGEVSGSPDVLSELITVPAGRFVMWTTDFYADEGLEREV